MLVGSALTIVALDLLVDMALFMGVLFIMYLSKKCRV